jgi:hypothetical protein
MTDMTPAEALAGQIIDRLDEDTRRKLEELLQQNNPRPTHPQDTSWHPPAPD